MSGKETEWQTEITKIHHTKYVRNSRAIAVAWFVFCACYTILNIVAFIQPYWFGDTNESPGVGYFGLHEWCERIQGSEYRCSGDFLDFKTIANDYFRASSFLVGFSALLFILSIVGMLLFLFLKGSIVLRVCGWFQLLAAICMAVACIIFPNAFDDANVKRICGQEAKAYNMDNCQIRWAYILGIVLIFDAAILACLAFVLAARQAKLLPKKEKDGHINRGFSGNIMRGDDTPMQESLRQRHPNSLPGTARSDLYRVDDSFTIPKEPYTGRNTSTNPPKLVIPVDSFGGSTSSESSIKSTPPDTASPNSPESDEDEIHL